MDPRVEERLNPPYMRSSLLYAIELCDGGTYRSIAELRRQYPHLPRPLTLEKLAKEVRVLANNLLAWEKYRKRKPGAPKKTGSEVVAKAKRLRAEGKTLRAIAEEVGRSRTWVQKNT